MKTRILIGTLLAAFAASLTAEDGRFEKTVPVPRSGDVQLGWTYEKCTVRSLTLRNYPSEEDIEEAQRSDPDDKSWLWWEFNLDNRGSRDCKVRLAVEVLDKSGSVIKSSDRSGTVDAGQVDDDIRVSTLMKTLQIVEAPRVRLRAEIIPK